MNSRNWVQSLLTFIIIIGITTTLFLYTAGYRLSRNEGGRAIDLQKTGMISAKSIPEGSSVYLNGILMTATNDTIQGVEPGMHTLKIIKNGFVTWTKEIEVFPELVTDITAIMVSQSPRLEPLTNTGAKNPTISPTLAKLAYFSKDPEEPGIRIIPLTQEGLNLFRSAPYAVIPDTPRLVYSDGKSLEWSPDEKSLLVEAADGTFYVVDITEKTALPAVSSDVIKRTWNAKLLEDRADFLEKVEVPEEIKKLAIEPTSSWAPDGKKILYTVTKGDSIEYHVYNMENPIPVGEKVENIVLTLPTNATQPKVNWYADSFHLIITEGFNEENKRGTVSIVRIDGTNKTEVYNNTLYSDTVFSSPTGDRLIILTSFKSGDQTDLYTIGVR